MNFVFDRNERVYIVGNVDGSSNPAFETVADSPTNSDYVCAISFDANSPSENLENPCKTGSLSKLAGVRGRSTGRCSLVLPVQGSGTAGTAPDMGPALSAWFGANPTISGGVSVTYALSDTAASVTAWSYVTPSGGSHRCAWGFMPDEIVFQASAQLAQVTISGPCCFVIDSNVFSSLTTAEKGGLSSFPAEPGSPAGTGSPVAGFIGSITIDGVSTHYLESWTLTIRKGVSIDHAYNSYVATIPSQSRRTIQLDYTLADTDDASLTALKAKLLLQTAHDVTIVQGTTAGNIWTHTLQNLQGQYSYAAGGNRRNVRFTGTASSDSATANNEYGLVLT